MKVKELIEELKKCNPDAEVKVCVIQHTRNYEGKVTEVNVGNPKSCANPVTIFAE